MTYVALDQDLVVGLGRGTAAGPALPPALEGVPLRYLRVDGEVVIDVRGAVREWHIDPVGRPRVDPGPDRQVITCAGDASLVRDANGWRVETDADRRAAAQTRLLAEADASVGRLRAALVTTVEGQSEAYAAKGAEVQAWEAAGEPADPNPTDYPWAADRSALLTALADPADPAVTIADVMAEWRARREAWLALLRATERAREAAKARLGAAADVGAAEAVGGGLTAVCTALAADWRAAAAAGGVPDVQAAISVLDGIAWPL